MDVRGECTREKRERKREQKQTNKQVFLVFLVSLTFIKHPCGLRRCCAVDVRGEVNKGEERKQKRKQKRKKEQKKKQNKKKQKKTNPKQDKQREQKTEILTRRQCHHYRRLWSRLA